MCEWGTDVDVRVKTLGKNPCSCETPNCPNTLDRWQDIGIDSCIAGLVKALQEGGVDMLASCCGHGKASGRIDLTDGRTLMVVSRAEADANGWRTGDYRPDTGRPSACYVVTSDAPMRGATYYPPRWSDKYPDGYFVIDEWLHEEIATTDSRVKCWIQVEPPPRTP